MFDAYKHVVDYGHVAQTHASTHARILIRKFAQIPKPSHAHTLMLIHTYSRMYIYLQAHRYHNKAYFVNTYTYIH